MQTPAALDQAKVEQFVGKVLGGTSATRAVIGDRLGPFKELAASGPAERNAGVATGRKAVSAGDRHPSAWSPGRTTNSMLQRTRVLLRRL